MKGHIRERSPGHWAIIVDARDSSGARKRRWHSFRGTKREAQVECARLIHEAQTGAAVDPSRATLNEYLDRFLSDWVSTHCTPRSAERYAGSLAHVRKALGAKKLQAIKPVDLATLYADMARSGLAPRTVKHAHVVAHRAFGLAKVWGLLKDNPADLAKPPAPKAAKIEVLQPAQAKRLLERLTGDLRLIASVLLGTGLRRNELLALRWKDLDLDGGKLTVEQALEQTWAHGIQTKGPKTKHGERTISIPPHIVEELRAHRLAQAQQRLALGLGKAPDDSTVLADVDGRPLSPNAVSKAWKRAMTGVTLHSLRHTHASMLIAAGMDVFAISKRLGHAKPSITLDVYGHLVHGADDRAAKIMQEAFGR